MFIVEYECDYSYENVEKFFNNEQDFHDINAVNSKFEIEQIFEIFNEIREFLVHFENWEIIFVEISSEYDGDEMKTQWDFKLTNPETLSSEHFVFFCVWDDENNHSFKMSFE